MFSADDRHRTPLLKVGLPVYSP